MTSRLSHFAMAGLCMVALGLVSMPAAARPKVCLVLSGGGARGAAHVGVLKVLEELRVPIDCIAGTSMGSIVGASYASGMSIADMESLINQISVASLIQENPPRRDLSIRRKIDDRSILVGPEIGLKDGGLLLPNGVLSGVQLESFLRRLAKVHGYRRFDDLPIPFRAVATNLVTGKPVVFSEGELPDVMRASMSVPGAVAPAEISGMLLVDGGLTDNLPVDVARAMGADIIIAVNLGSPLLKRDEVQSVLGVTNQMINILTQQNVDASLASLKPGDILIEPKLGDFSATDFDHLAKTLPIGEAAARSVESRLATLSITRDDYAALRVRQSASLPPDTRPIDEIRFEPLARVNPTWLQDVMKTRPGEPLDQAVLDRDMQRLFGTDDLEHVDYRIIDDGGKRVLDIDAVEKSWGPDYLRFGIGLGSDLRGDTFFNLAVSYRRTWINTLGGEWRSDVQIGHTSHLFTELYQPITTDHTFFVAPRANVERQTVDVFQGKEQIAAYDVRTANAGIDFGVDGKQYGEARFGIQAGTARASLSTGPGYLTPPSGVINQNAFRVRGIFDQLDSVNFPRYGATATAEIFAPRTMLGADQSYTKASFDLVGAYSIDRNTLQAAVKLGGPIGGGQIPRYELFQWGGFLQQSGYAPGQLLGERLTFGRVVYYYKVVDQQLFYGVYVGGSLEAGQMSHPLVPGSPEGVLKSGSLFVAVDTPIGPLYLGFGRAQDGNRSAYLYLGRP